MEKVIKKGTSGIVATCYTINATKEVSTQNQNWKEVLKEKPKVPLSQEELDHAMEFKQFNQHQTIPLAR